MCHGLGFRAIPLEPNVGQRLGRVHDRRNVDVSLQHFVAFTKQRPNEAASHNKPAVLRLGYEVLGPVSTYWKHASHFPRRFDGS